MQKTEQQMEILLAQYRKEKYPDKATIAQMAVALKLTPKEVKVWFNNNKGRGKVQEKLNHQKNQRKI